jgi:hypothetical protein
VTGTWSLVSLLLSKSNATVQDAKCRSPELADVEVILIIKNMIRKPGEEESRKYGIPQ